MKSRAYIARPVLVLLTLSLTSSFLTYGDKDEGVSSTATVSGNAVMKEKKVAVAKALDWLKAHQITSGERKGAWKAEPQDDVHCSAITGLALLAFLAHGETVDSEKYGDTVEMAIGYLLGCQGKDDPAGAFCPLKNQGVYGHAIATYAIGEATQMTQRKRLKKSLEEAIKIIVKGQQPGGGWDYSYNKGHRRDTSVAVWQILALEAAYKADCAASGLLTAIPKATGDIKRCYLPEKGRFGYTIGSAEEGTTPEGILCLQKLGHGKANETVTALKTLDDEKCLWDRKKDHPMHTWFFISRAKCNWGGETWNEWVKEFVPAYVENQFKDGHWSSPSEKENKYGSALTTSLGALTLQIPSYRSDIFKPGY